MSLPTVELIEGAIYWIKKAHKDQDLWTIARWEHGIFWDLKGSETTPRLISGPVPQPKDNENG